MKIRKDGRERFQKSSIDLRKGSPERVSKEGFLIRKGGAKPRSVKNFRGFRAYRLKMGKNRLQRSQRNLLFGKAEGGELRSNETQLQKKEIRYFRKLPRSKRQKILRDVQKRMDDRVPSKDVRTAYGKSGGRKNMSESLHQKHLPFQKDQAFRSTQSRTGGIAFDRKGKAFYLTDREEIYNGNAVDLMYGPGTDRGDGDAKAISEKAAMALSGAAFEKSAALERQRKTNKARGLEKQDPFVEIEEEITAFLPDASPEQAQAAHGKKTKGSPTDYWTLSYGTLPFAKRELLAAGRTQVSPETGDAFWEGGRYERRVERRELSGREKAAGRIFQEEVSKERYRETAKKTQKKRRARKLLSRGLFSIYRGGQSENDRQETERRWLALHAFGRNVRRTKMGIRFFVFLTPALPAVLTVLLLLFLLGAVFGARDTRLESEVLTGTSAEIYAYLRGHAAETLQDIQIAAILGNMYAESDLSPLAVEGSAADGGGWTVEDFPTIHYDGSPRAEAESNPFAYRGYGLLMWAGNRANHLQEKAEELDGRWNILAVQLAHFMDELEDEAMWGYGEYSKEDFYSAETVDEATRAFYSAFVMHGGEAPENFSHLEEIRIPKAADYYRRMISVSFSYTGEFGEMDAFGAMNIPWIRQDVGLFDPDTRTWSHADEGSVVILPGHTIASNGCGTCSAAMALSYCTGSLVLPSALVANPNFVHNSIGEYQMPCTASLAASYGVPVVYTGSRAEVTAALSAGCPVMILVIGGAPNGRATRGHYFLLSGYEAETGRYILTDPGGEGFGSPNCLTYVEPTSFVTGRYYIPSEHVGLYRQTFTWKEITEHQNGQFVIFGVSPGT